MATGAHFSTWVYFSTWVLLYSSEWVLRRVFRTLKINHDKYCHRPYSFILNSASINRTARWHFNAMKCSYLNKILYENHCNLYMHYEELLSWHRVKNGPTYFFNLTSSRANGPLAYPETKFGNKLFNVK